MSGNSPQSVHPAYRPDIDGLRAIAVASVVVFHAFPALLPGGFVGVDVFFVISGYLITQIILRNQALGRFSFLDFYARRVRRILPALLVVLLATFVAGWFTLFSQDFKALGLHVAGAAGFVSNIVLLREAGYFDTASELKPLLHLWSLAIEEQFYVFWPALLVLAQRAGLARLPLVAVLVAASFLTGLWLTQKEPASAFFFSPARFWEILVGGLLAMRELRGAARMLPGLSWLGAVLLLAGFALITQGRAFPGFWALLPVLGTAALIAAGPRGACNRVLGMRPLVALGLISYPLYLWHWPILVFLRLKGGSAVPAWMLVLGVVAALVLASLTYRLLERPIRFGRARGRAAVVLFALLLGVGYLGFNTYQREGLRFRAANKGNPAEFDWRAEWRHKACFLEARDSASASFDSLCDGPQDGRARVVLWGDSHAAAIYPGFADQAQKRGFSLAQYTAAACPPVFDLAVADRPQCAAMNAHMRARLTANPPQVLVLAGFWTLYFGADARFNGLDEAKIEQTLSVLRAMGLRQVVLLGPVPAFRREVPKFAAALFRPGETVRTRQELDEAVFEVDAKMRTLALRNGLTYASPLDALCNAEGCLISASNAQFEPLQWDTHHLTSRGARFVLNDMLARNPLMLTPR